MKLKVKILEINNSDVSLLRTLFKSCEWDWLKPDRCMMDAIKNSFLAMVGFWDNKPVCFGRVISDGYIYGLMVDIIVAPEHRRKGYGKELTRLLLEESKKKGLKVIQLLSSKEGKRLYAGIGFQACPDHSPGMIQFLHN